MVEVNAEEFLSNHKNMAPFVGSTLWNLVVGSLQNKHLWSHILFNVEVMELPPMLVLIKSYGIKLPSKSAAMRVGALVAYIMDKLGYEPAGTKMYKAKDIGCSCLAIYRRKK